MDRDVRRAARSAVVVASLGIELALSIMAGAWIGHWLDGQFETGPWLTVLFLGLGVAAGFRGLWRTARKNWPRGDDGAGQDEEARR